MLLKVREGLTPFSRISNSQLFMMAYFLEVPN